MSELLEAYERIKAECGRDNAVKQLSPAQRTAWDTKRLAFRTEAVKECERLKECCANRLLLDIYMRILPFDTGWADANRGQCQADISAFLADKKQSAEEYLKSAYNETKAPLLDYFLRAINGIGRQFMEYAEESRAEAERAGMNIPAPTVNDEEVEAAFVDIKDDCEYGMFIDKLKRKTIKKIVADISHLIADEKSVKDMTFEPKTESAFNVAYDYITKSFIKAEADFPSDNDELIGLAIRESVLNVLDCVFEQPGKLLEHFSRKVRRGNGVLVGGGKLNEFVESYKLFPKYNTIWSGLSKTIENALKALVIVWGKHCNVFIVKQEKEIRQLNNAAKELLGKANDIDRETAAKINALIRTNAFWRDEDFENESDIRFVKHHIGTQNSNIASLLKLVKTASGIDAGLLRKAAINILPATSEDIKVMMPSAAVLSIAVLDDVEGAVKKYSRFLKSKSVFAGEQNDIATVF